MHWPVQPKPAVSKILNSNGNPKPMQRVTACSPTMKAKSTITHRDVCERIILGVECCTQFYLSNVNVEAGAAQHLNHRAYVWTQANYRANDHWGFNALAEFNSADTPLKALPRVTMPINWAWVWPTVRTMCFRQACLPKSCTSAMAMCVAMYLGGRVRS